MRRTGGWWLAMIAVSVVATAASPALADGPRLIFDVRESFRVGTQVFPAGKLSVRNVTELTPVSTIQEVWVGADRVGFMIVRRGRSEAPVTESTAVFERRGDGPLVLIGYSLPGRRTGTFYRVARHGEFAAAYGAQTVIVAAR